jgi:hypothetical protein
MDKETGCSVKMNHKKKTSYKHEKSARKYTEQKAERQRKREAVKEKYRKFQDDMTIARGCFESFGVGYQNDYRIIIEELFSNWCEEHDKDEYNKEAFNEFVLSDSMKNRKHQERLRRIRETKTQEFYYQYYLWEYYFRHQETKDDRNKAVKKAKKQWKKNYKEKSLEIYGVENNYVDNLGGEDCPLTNEIINNGHLCTGFLDMI